ncbi:MAG: Na+/H+ antiporter NhaC family protein [Chlorobi bacterium]|nr:Na+/H+ antiporter NhaC family protein [Chlorobiota bacterium]
MRKIYRLLILTSFLFQTAAFGQSVSPPDFALTNILFQTEITLADSASVPRKLVFTDGEKSFGFPVKKIGNKYVAEGLIPEAGKYDVYLSGAKIAEVPLRVIPGWLSLVPPLLAILLALIIRQVVVSLAAGIFVGAVIIYDYNPFIAFLRMGDTTILNAVIDPDHMMVILFTLLIGGVVGLISKNGGTASLANIITKFAKTARSGMIASWFMGIIIFFDDYANSLIIGNMMRPITDKLRISREKLAYIVDSTAAPIASIVIISTWIGYELGLIGEGLKVIGWSESAYDVFLKTIPYRFYPIAALFFVFIVSYFQRDFGPMLKAERRARKTGKVAVEVEGIEIEEIADVRIEMKALNRWYNGAIPILIILFGTIAGLIYTGINKLDAMGIADYSLRLIISNSNSYSSLLWASLLAGVVAVVMSTWQKILNLHNSMNAWFKGIESMLLASLILVFAWGISSITTDLKTADYLISILSDSIDPRLLPVIVFLLCAFISFATGTSWGTMAIVMPIVIPLAFKMSATFGFTTAATTLVIHGVISSVLTGSVFGDHCSPIADTTILSSLASKCNHIDHVKTQLPYAILVGSVTMLLGDIPTAFGMSPYVSIILIFGLLTGALFVFGKKVVS